MMSDDKSNELIDRLRGLANDVWRPRPPATEEALAAVESSLRLRFDEQYRRLLLYSGGGSLYGAEAKLLFIKPQQLTMFNPDMERAPDLAQMLIFGDDQGDYFYYFDHRNLLRRGAWAVFAVEMSVATRDGSKYVARDLCELVERVVAGEAILDAPTVKDAPAP
jgi:SMI1/KNR4 family protein SUKH-1